MKNNLMDKVSINNSRHPKARFNLSHDVNSTYHFGEVQPIICKQMMPEESDDISISSMVRLAPMVAPTFGRIKHKEWHHFVPMSDLWPHFGNFLAQTTYDNKYPRELPHMKLGLLSLWCLVGAKMTFYDSPNLSAADSDSSLYSLYKISGPFTQLTSEISTLLNHIKSYQNNASSAFGFNASGSLVDWSISQTGYTINGRWLIPSHLSSSRVPIQLPVSNFNEQSFFNILNPNDLAVAATSLINDIEFVSLDSADAVIPYKYTFVENNVTRNRVLLIACRFSDFGRRLYKILVGCGYQFDLSSSQEVSLMPLFAFYKAYFDQFGLNRLEAWSDTRCYTLLQKIDYNNAVDFNSVIDGTNGYIGLAEWCKFIRELGTCFVTEDLDFVSAHTTKQPVPTRASAADSGSVILGGVSEGTNPILSQTTSAKPVGDLTLSNNLMDISSQRLSGLDIKAMMRIYRWINRKSLAGQEIAKQLRAQGYGYFLYSCKSNFIGYTEQLVPVYDVVNSSDTFDSATGQGMLLGDYAGRGIGYEESRPLRFEADEYGYWVGLCAVVPESGYTQGLDTSVLATTKYDLYTPEFDGLGYEVTPKSSVCGSLPFGDASNPDKLKDGFGFIPRYSGLKVAKNIANGGFSLRSGKRIFSPYTLDKQIDVGERFVALQNDQATSLLYRVAKVFSPDLFPEAGEFWRYVSRYPWLGNFDRIFSQQIHNSDVLNMLSVLNDNPFFEFVVWSDENFMIHHLFNHTMYANMLPISDSFDTGIEGEGPKNDSIEMN